MRCFILSFIIILILNEPLFSQESKKDYSKLTTDEINKLSYDELLLIPLDDLMKLSEQMGVSVNDLLTMKITISSKTKQTSRESPSIVSIVTADEIKNSGARDLIDILSMVPGFHFGYDLDGVIGISGRGNWGHEGKILILLDGQEMNENFYSTYQFGNRIPVDQIKRIEIIRGPGSSIYGGYAELGVINIITKEASDIKGITVGTASGLMSRGTLRNDFTLATGQKFNDLEYTLSGYYSYGHRSNATYTYSDNEHFYDMAKDAGVIASKYFNSSLSYKNLKMRFIYNDYKTQAFDYLGLPFDYFTDYLSEVKYDWQCSDKLVITPKINIKKQIPWRMSYSGADTSYYYNKSNIRYSGNINAQYEPIEKINVVYGIEWLNDRAKDLLSDTSSYFNNGKKAIAYNNIATYLQCIVKTRFVNINIGGRYDKHNQYGSNFSPRLGITKVFNKLHFKVLYSKAFRAPAIENININPDIKPELTSVTEFETGYQFNKSLFLTANIFDVSIKNPIVYDYIDQNEVYTNFKSTGTRGFEVECRFVKRRGYITANYSFYYSSDNKVSTYKVANDKSYLLGFPKHKASLNSSYKITENISINPSVILNGVRYAFLLNNDYSIELGREKPYVILNFFSNYENFFIKRLDLGFGIYDIFNSGYEFIQPYGSPTGGDFPPLPGYYREFLIRLNYRFEL